VKSKLTVRQLGFIVLVVLASMAVANYDKLLPHRWRTYTAPDRSFSVDFPAQPKVETAQAPIEGGGTAPMTIISAQPTATAAYMCSYVENENIANKSPDEMLQAAKDGGLEKIQGKAITEKRLTIQGYPALNVQAHARGNSLADIQFVVAGKRLYMLMVVNTAAEDREQKSVERLFSSFKVLKK
jgi:hypothetical protein